MYVDRWVYNPLNRWVRSKSKMLTSIYAVIAAIMIPTAFLLQVESVSWEWSAVSLLIGISSLIVATARSNKEDIQKDKDKEYGFKLLEAIATIMGVDVSKITK